MRFPHELATTAGLKGHDLAVLCGVSDVTGHRWMKGGGVNVLLLRRVRRLVSSIDAAITSKRLPDGDIMSLPPRLRMEKYREILGNFTE